MILCFSDNLHDFVDGVRDFPSLDNLFLISVSEETQSKSCVDYYTRFNHDLSYLSLCSQKCRTRRNYLGKM